MVLLNKEEINKTKFISVSMITNKRLQVYFQKHGYKNLYSIINNFDNMKELSKSEKRILKQKIIQCLTEINDNFRLIIQKKKNKYLFFHYEDNFEKEITYFLNLFITAKYKNFGERNIEIMNKRFGFSLNKVETLDDIGYFYGLSRERIRQICNDILEKFHNFLFDSKSNISNLLRDKLIMFNQKILNYKYIITFDEVVKELDNIFNFAKKDKILFVEFLLNLFKYEEIRNNQDYKGSICKSWYKKDFIEIKKIRTILNSFNWMIKEYGLIEKDHLIKESKKIMKNRYEDNELILEVLKICEEFEIFDGKYIQKRNIHLPINEQINRIFVENGEPLHYKEIFKLIINNKELNFRNLTAILSNDHRFKNLSKSGYWTLSSDNLENITLKDAIKKVLLKDGKEMHIDDIFNKVANIRFGTKKSSISTYLYQTSLFINSKPNFFKISTGKEMIQRNKKSFISESRVEINEFLKEFLINEKPLQNTINEVKKYFSYSEQVIRRFLQHNEHIIKLKKEKSIYVKYISANENNNKITLRENIHNEIRSILYANPNKAYTKKYLFNEILKKINCHKHTFYTYLREMNDIEQWQESPREYLVEYKYTENLTTINFDENMINSIFDNELKKNLLNCKEYLSIEKIEIGIYKLSSYFEDIIRKFLQLSKTKGLYNITNNDLSKLVKMISCIERENIVEKDFYLNVLREVRNKIVHEEIQNISLKKELFFQAHYIVPLYVKYIVIFERKIKEISL